MSLVTTEPAPRVVKPGDDADSAPPEDGLASVAEEAESLDSVESEVAATDVATTEEDPFAAERLIKAERRVVYEQLQLDLADLFQSSGVDDHLVEEYSWTATGTFRESADALEEGPWTAEGRVYDGRYPESLVSMSAADISALRQNPLVSTPADQMVRRHGYRSVSYTTGLHPEMLPEWAAPDVDADIQYITDPFGIPADLFPEGLGDEGQWLRLRAVPEIVELEGWDFSRVTRGRVDPQFWNYRYRLGDGFFAWILSEDDGEVFEVTIGADENGRMQRFGLVTTDPDGGGAIFDIVIDKHPKGFLPVAAEGGPEYLSVRRDWTDDSTDGADDAAAFDDFVAASREQFPSFEHVRRPQYLTVLTERVKDEPSGAYEPQGEYYTWPSVYFKKETDIYLESGVGVVCLELEDNEWRFEDNTFEKFWRGYTDGTSLDGAILRFNANGWMKVDIYATDGERHSGDPCSSLLASEPD